ncbi:MAG: hypothetical protein QOG96_951, partial [Pseudonocardiales bacterium]|nr:hypothetical protein [Pseudonocardiales bacterium]
MPPPARSIVTETNLSPVFFATIQPQVDLGASITLSQQPEQIGPSPTVTVAALRRAAVCR